LLPHGGIGLAVELRGERIDPRVGEAGQVERAESRIGVDKLGDADRVGLHRGRPAPHRHVVVAALGHVEARPDGLLPGALLNSGYPGVHADLEQHLAHQLGDAQAQRIAAVDEQLEGQRLALQLADAVAVAVHDARLVQQAAGGFRIVDGDYLRVEVGRGRVNPPGAADGGRAQVDRVHQILPVDGQRDRLAHLQTIERGAPDVVVEHLGGEERPLSDGDALQRRQQIDLLRRN